MSNIVDIEVVQTINQVDIEVNAVGKPGTGVIVGGTTGQTLKKKSDTSFDTEWGDDLGIRSVVGGAGINVVTADPANPIISFTGTTSAGFLANLYYRTDASDISGYKRISYEIESVETEVSGTVKKSEGDKLFRTYLYDSAIGVSYLDAGVWQCSFTTKVSTANSITNLIVVGFLRHTDNTETDLFTIVSRDINDTTYASITENSTQPLFPCVPTDRFGVRIKARTTKTGDITVTTITGDGRGCWFSTPLPLRHSLLRGRDDADQHPISAITGLEAPMDGKLYGRKNGGWVEIV